MNAEELLNIIRNNLDNTFIEESTSLTCYDPDKLQNKVSFKVFETNEHGTYVRFHITIDDVIKNNDGTTKAFK